MEVLDNFEHEYDVLIAEIELLKQKRIAKLKKKFSKKLDFKVGDVIYNVTGIIKIESIDFKIGHNGRDERLPIHVIFKGTKYKWIKGGLITTVKNNQQGELYSYSELKQIDKSKII